MKVGYYLLKYEKFQWLLQALFNRKLAPTAFKVALIVGTILFTINHGAAIVQGKMNRNRWLSGLLTYLGSVCKSRSPLGIVSRSLLIF